MSDQTAESLTQIGRCNIRLPQIINNQTSIPLTACLPKTFALEVLVHVHFPQPKQWRNYGS